MFAPPLPSEKSTLRRRLRALRNRIPPTQRKSAARRIERLAVGTRFLARGRRIGFYMPSKGEADILPLLNRALWMGVECYLPVVPPRAGRWHGRKRLWFTRLGDVQRHWSLNRYGIPEYGLRHDRRRVWRLDVLFLPMIGFDAEGYRMGMGGGYYDASLAYLARRRVWRRPRLVGVAFDLQGVVRLPRDPWDIPLDAVITERKVYRFRNRVPDHLADSASPAWETQ